MEGIWRSAGEDADQAFSRIGSWSKDLSRRELAGRCELRYPRHGADHEIEFTIRDET